MPRVVQLLDVSRVLLVISSAYTSVDEVVVVEAAAAAIGEATPSADKKPFSTRSGTSAASHGASWSGK
jgi:hypothetical protein